MRLGWPQGRGGSPVIKVQQVLIEKSFEALAAQLKSQILNGDLPPGEILNERMLTEQSGLSRGSVREALRVLETQGLLETRRGRNGGRMVIAAGVQPIMESLDTYIRNGNPPAGAIRETIELLEPGMAAIAARNRTSADVAAMTAAIDQLAATRDPADFIHRNADWHQALVRATGNPILGAVYAAIGPGLLDPRLETFVTDAVRADVLHAARQILAAIIAGDAALAARRMTRHVDAYHRLLYPDTGAE